MVIPKAIELERIVLRNSQELFDITRRTINNYENKLQNPTYLKEVRNGSKTEKIHDGGANVKGSILQKLSKYDSILWWQPSLDSTSMEFCRDSSMHGLKFVAQPKRHISERIFWICGFLMGITAASLLINDVWSRYKQNPVIVSFKTTDQNIDALPFPAVTICNVNKFPKKKVEEIMTLAYDSGPWEEGNAVDEARDMLQFIHSACTAQQSFSKVFNFSYTRGKLNISIDADNLSNASKATELTEFLLKYTIPCDKLIHHCLWAENPISCGKIFKPILTDYGKCCSFNILPSSIMFRVNPRHVGRILSKNSTKTISRWNSEETEQWKKWKFAEGFLLEPNLVYPHRQLKAGVPYGLSFLVDPHTEEYFCPMGDSEGVRFVLHSPTEMPQVTDVGSVIGLENEVFIEVQPDVTMADDDISTFDVERRKCIFGTEQPLEFYRAYTTGILEFMEYNGTSDEVNLQLVTNWNTSFS